MESKNEIAGQASYSIYKDAVKTRRDGSQLREFNELSNEEKDGWKTLDADIYFVRNFAYRMGYEKAVKDLDHQQKEAGEPIEKKKVEEIQCDELPTDEIVS